MLALARNTAFSGRPYTAFSSVRFIANAQRSYATAKSREGATRKQTLPERFSMKGKVYFYPFATYHQANEPPRPAWLLAQLKALAMNFVEH